MKQIAAAAAFLLGISVLGAQGAAGKISAAQAKSLFEGGKAVIVDVRTEAEYEAGHIPGALLIPNESIGSVRPAPLKDLDATIIVYCRTGRRSAEAAKKLTRMGYTDVRDLGGIGSWPYGTVTGKEP